MKRPDMKRSVLLYPTVVCALCVILFIALGVWQIQRLSWKNNLQAQIDNAFSQTDLPVLTDDDFRSMDENTISRGQKYLELDLNKSIIVNGRVMDAKPAVAVVTPAHAKDLTKSVMVEIGCIRKIDADDFINKATVQKKIVGIIRYPQWSYFTPENNLQRTHWWRMDSAEFMNYFRTPFYDAYLTAENASGLIKGLSPCPIYKQLRNNHLSYALFWFTAAGLMVLLWYLRFVRPQKSICNPHTGI